MTTVPCELPETAFKALGLTPAEMPRELRLAASVQWYAQGVLSQGRAAEVAGLARAEFLRELARRGVSAIQTTADEIETELRLIRAARR